MSPFKAGKYRRGLIVIGVFSAMFVYGAAAGSAGASPSAPTTDITHQPSDVSRQPTATFTFSSSLRHSTFACQIDGSAWQSCTSPVTYKALANGSHQFSVKAISEAGVTDPDPPVSSWVVAHALPRLVFPVDRGAGTAAATVFSPSAGTMIPVKVVEPRGSWNTGVYTITYLGQSLCTIDTGTPHRITTCGKVPSCVRRLAVCSARYSSHLRMTDSRNAAIEDLPVTIALTQLSTSRKATPNHANWLGFSYRFPVRAQTTATVSQREDRNGGLPGAGRIRACRAAPISRVLPVVGQDGKHRQRATRLVHRVGAGQDGRSSQDHQQADQPFLTPTAHTSSTDTEGSGDTPGPSPREGRSGTLIGHAG